MGTPGSGHPSSSNAVACGALDKQMDRQTAKKDKKPNPQNWDMELHPLESFYNQLDDFKNSIFKDTFSISSQCRSSVHIVSQNIIWKINDFKEAFEIKLKSTEFTSSRNNFTSEEEKCLSQLITGGKRKNIYSLL